jgi:hypothetical protein
LDFAGPSISCTELQGSAIHDIQKNIQAAVAIDNCTTAFAYIGWTPSYLPPTTQGAEDTLYTLPFFLSQNNASYSLNGSPLGPLPGYTGNQTVPPATFYAAIYHNMTDEITYSFGGPTCAEQGQLNNDSMPNITVFQCELQNSSYHTSFEYINGEQTINITVDATPYNSVTPIYEYVVGSGYFPLANYSENGDVIGYLPDVAKTTAYQSVMSSFGAVFVGTVWNSVATLGGVVSSNTTVMSTVIGETEELLWLNGYPADLQNSGQVVPATLQEDLQEPGNHIYWNGVDVVDVLKSTMPFKSALEGLFQNITVGLMSSRLLQ